MDLGNYAILAFVVSFIMVECEVREELYVLTYQISKLLSWSRLTGRQRPG